jgi:hypothetical protein
MLVDLATTRQFAGGRVARRLSDLRHFSKFDLKGIVHATTTDRVPARS